MELPFKYIVLCMVETLNDRKMSLTINKAILVNYINVVISNLFYTIDEKKELSNCFDFQYELDDLLDKYYKYFEIKGDDIIFDEDYIDDLDLLKVELLDEYDTEIIEDIDYVIEGNTMLLDILGVKINKKLYEFLIDIEKEIEQCYDDLYVLESNLFEISRNKEETCDKLKKLYMKKIIMLINSKNLLSELEYSDVKNYSHNIVDRISDEDDIHLLYESDTFDASDIVSDVFLNSIFTNNDSYICNLDETFNIYDSKSDCSGEYSKVKFYIKFISLLDKEIACSCGLLKSELIKVKYRLMNTLDSVCGTATFVGDYNSPSEDYVESYDFNYEAVYYFINEILMYDDDKYRNKEFDTENIMIYLDNIVKKILIETYYKLTDEDMIIKTIVNNKLYGVNGISSGFLRDIVEKPKVKIKEV